LHGALLHAPLLICCLGQVMVRLLMCRSLRSCKPVAYSFVTWFST
jgi:hypothetical protein